MTRRTLVYQENGQVYTSQEFNGDRAEGVRALGHSVVTVDWSEIVAMFNGVPATLAAFRKVVEKAEKAFTYELCPLTVSDKIPSKEEVWLFADGKLSLYSVCGEKV